MRGQRTNQRSLSQNQNLLYLPPLPPRVAGGGAQRRSVVHVAIGALPIATLQSEEPQLGLHAGALRRPGRGGVVSDPPREAADDGVGLGGGDRRGGGDRHGSILSSRIVRGNLRGA